MILLHYFLFITCLLLTGVHAQQTLFPFHHGELLSFCKFTKVFKSYMSEENSLKGIPSTVHNILTLLMSSSFPTAVAEGIDEQCKADSVEYVHNLYGNLSIWALQMHESSGKLPIGFYGMGNYRADGLFDECLAIRAPAFDGQYCTVFLKPVTVNESEVISNISPEIEDRKNLITIMQLLGQLSGSADRVDPKVEEADINSAYFPSISFCLPSSCSAQDLGNAVAQLVGSYVFSNSTAIVTVADAGYCFKDRNEPKPSFNGADIAVIVTLSTLGFIVLIATLHESYREYIGEPINVKTELFGVKVLHCFSFLNNSRKLLSVKVSASADNLGCIHGIRFFSMCWVVLGHTWIVGPSRLAVNPDYLYRDALTWTFQTITSATVSVDTFFVMSGLLASYLLLRELERSNGKLNLAMLYIHRYLRLTLLYAIVLGFTATLIVYIATGPNWYNVTLNASSCREHWWKLLLYINNLYPTSEGASLCMGQTWYLANDMQFFLIAPFLVYPLWRWQKLGLVILSGVILATLASNFAVHAVYNLPPTFMNTRRDVAAVSQDYTDKYYVKPWTRAPPYLVGIWIGWVLFATRQSQKRLPKWAVASFWTLSTAIALAILYGLTPYLDEDKVPTISRAVSMTYGPLHCTAWALVISWIIFACCRGYGGIVNRILSWQGFLPLGRLTYCVYLIHIDFLNVYYAAERRLYYYTFFTQLTTFLGALSIILAIAFVVSSTIEASLLHLEKLLISPKDKKEPAFVHVDQKLKNDELIDVTAGTKSSV